MNVAGASGGGIVRSGPSTNFTKITSLNEFEPLVIVGRANNYDQGFDWFIVRYRNGQQGYQSGGLICTNTQRVQGTWGYCSDLRAALSGNSGGNQGNNGNQNHHEKVVYYCDTGERLNVEYNRTANDDWVTFNFPNERAYRLEPAQSGSGFLYSDGLWDLQGKGNQVLVPAAVDCSQLAAVIRPIGLEEPRAHGAA